MLRPSIRILVLAHVLLVGAREAFGQEPDGPTDPRVAPIVLEARAALRKGDVCEASRTARRGAARATTAEDALFFRDIEREAASKCQFRLDVHAASPCKEKETRVWLRPAGSPRGVHVDGEIRRDGCSGTFEVSAVEPADYQVEIEADGMRLEFRKVGVSDRGALTITLGPLTPLDPVKEVKKKPPELVDTWRIAGTGLLALAGCLAVAGAVSTGLAAAGDRGALAPTVALSVGALGTGLGGLYLTLSPPVPAPPASRGPTVGLSLGYQF